MGLLFIYFLCVQMLAPCLSRPPISSSHSPPPSNNITHSAHSTCKAFGELCGVPKVVELDLKEARYVFYVCDCVHGGSLMIQWGSSCQASPLINQHLTHITTPTPHSKTLRFPNRLLRVLARPGSRLESLSVKNAHTREMCRNLGSKSLCVFNVLYVWEWRE